MKRDFKAAKRCGRGNISDIIGRWPGDETDEQIDAALREMS